MPPVRYQLPPLADDADFDRLCRDLFRHHWPVEGDQLNGRSGQRQHGVDFYGQDPQGHWRGGQSKSRNSLTAPLGEAEVREEVRKALAFTPALHEYVIATSGPRDARLQQVAREITDAHRRRRPRRFSVKIYFWDDLLELLHQYPEVRAAYYGQLSDVDVAAMIAQLREIVADGAPQPSATGVSLPAPPPIVRHTLVGRDQELGRALAALRERRPALLHGMGGVGKTTLAAEIAARLQDEHAFGDGIIWIEDIGNASLDEVCDAIARQIGNPAMAGLTGRDKASAVRGLLAAQDALLVLDDVASSATGRAFVDACLPRKRALLMTSRERSLRADFSEAILLAPLAQEAAVALFRAAVGVATNQGDHTIAAICTLLEGHPLALVVAAGRVRAEEMPLERLHDRLADERSRLSSLHLDESDDRRRNVRASLQLSLDGLDARQREVFLALALCFGETTGVELLAELLGFSQVDCEDVVGQLVARSLVERRGERLRLHRLVRDLGRERAADTASAIRLRLITAAHAYADRYAEPTLERHDKLETELGNLSGIFQYAVEHGERRDAVALALHIVNPVLSARGYRTQLVAIGRLALSAAAMLGDEVDLARLSLNLAGLLPDDHDETRRLYQQCLALKRRLGDRLGVAHCLHNLGVVACERGRLVAGRRLLGHGLAIRRALGDDHGIAASQLSLGQLAREEGAHKEARRLCEASRAMFAALGDLRGESEALYCLGNLAHERGEYAEAWDRYRDSLALKGEMKDQPGIAVNLNNLATILERMGRLGAARPILLHSLAIKQQLRDQRGIATTLHNLANLSVRGGDLDEAQGLYEQSLRIARRLGDRGGIATGIYGLAGIAHQRGEIDKARGLLAQSLALFEEVGSHHAATARRQLEKLHREEAMPDG